MMNWKKENKKYTKSFSDFAGEPIVCEVIGADGGTELCMSIDNTRITLQFASTVDLVNWCNDIKALAIEKLNDEE